MTEPLDELYLKWLYGQFSSVRLRNPAKTYWALAKQLYTKEFIWIIPNDDNRLEDGRDLRLEFIDQGRYLDVDRDWLHLGCSVLEMLIGLARRLEFETNEDTSAWFWQLLQNLHLRDFNDLTYGPETEEKTDEILDRLIWRTYLPDGEGGLFPLQHPYEDQTEVEIWYQLSAYLLEQG